MLCRASLLSSSLTSGEGGGVSMVTWVEAELFRPRESVQVALTVTGPGAAPAVFKLAVLPLPETEPPVAVQLDTLTCMLSGLLQSQLMLAAVPAGTEAGLAEQLMVGGFLGGSLTIKPVVHVAWLLRLALGSVTVAVAV